MESDPVVLVGTLVAVVLSITSHEAAHAWVADKLGDPTARQLGRVTLNPVPHIDLFMTILLPALLFMTSGFLFGGAKPVPVAVHRLRRPARDWALVALAGPAMNLVLALLFAGLLSAFLHLGIFELGVKGKYPNDPGVDILRNGLFINVLLAVFNMVPIPPLDGSRVVMYGLSKLGSRQALASYVQLERFGLMILLVLLFMVPGFRLLLSAVIEPIFGGMLTLVGLG